MHSFENKKLILFIYLSYSAFQASKRERFASIKGGETKPCTKTDETKVNTEFAWLRLRSASVG